MALTDLLLPDESITFTGPRVRLGTVDYGFYLSNRRLVLHSKSGWLGRNDSLISERLDLIRRVQLVESGLVFRDATVVVETVDNRLELCGSPASMKPVHLALVGVLTRGESQKMRRSREVPNRRAELAAILPDPPCVVPFCRGESVVVRWSDGTAYHATILSCDSASASIAFNDGRRAQAPVGALSRQPSVQRETIERQVLVTRCAYCRDLTPVDLSSCKNCGAKL